MYEQEVKDEALHEAPLNLQDRPDHPVWRFAVVGADALTRHWLLLLCTSLMAAQFLVLLFWNAIVYRRFDLGIDLATYFQAMVQVAHGTFNPTTRSTGHRSCTTTSNSLCGRFRYPR